MKSIHGKIQELVHYPMIYLSRCDYCVSLLCGVQRFSQYFFIRVLVSCFYRAGVLRTYFSEVDSTYNLYTPGRGANEGVQACNLRRDNIPNFVQTNRSQTLSTHFIMEEECDRLLRFAEEVHDAGFDVETIRVCADPATGSDNIILLDDRSSSLPSGIFSAFQIDYCADARHPNVELSPDTSTRLLDNKPNFSGGEILNEDCEHSSLHAYSPELEPKSLFDESMFSSHADTTVDICMGGDTCIRNVDEHRRTNIICSIPLPNQLDVIYYWPCRKRCSEENHALNYALNLSKEHCAPLIALVSAILTGSQ